MEWNEQKFDGVVFPPDNTSSPYTVVHMGQGLVEVGVLKRNGIYGLWLGKCDKPHKIGSTIGGNCTEKTDAGLVTVTFSNVESLSVALETLRKIKKKMKEGES